MSWSAVLGQPLAVRLLQQAIATDRVAHAYLFHGPGGIGKRTVALELAKALNCLKPEAGACDHCLSCKKIGSGSHPDLLCIEPEGRTIRIEQMRELQRQLYLRPGEGRWRVGIVNGADRMGTEAANSALKLLEEPPGYAVLILLAANLSGVLPTIMSRCQVISFRPMVPDTIIPALEGRGVGGAQAAVAAALSGGSLGRALQLAGDDDVAKRREETRRLLANLTHMDDAALLGAAEELEKRKEELADWFEVLLLWLRDALIVAEVAESRLLVNVDGEPFLQELARRHGASAIRSMLNAVVEAGTHMQRNANTRLVLDVMFLRLGTFASS